MNTIDLQHLDKELSRAEQELIKLREKVAELRRQRARQEMQDYTLRTPDGNKLKLSNMFNREGRSDSHTQHG